MFNVQIVFLFFVEIQSKCLRIHSLFLLGFMECTKFEKIWTIADQSRYGIYIFHGSFLNKRRNKRKLKIFKICKGHHKTYNENFIAGYISQRHPVLLISLINLRNRLEIDLAKLTPSINYVYYRVTGALNLFLFAINLVYFKKVICKHNGHCGGRFSGNYP